MLGAIPATGAKAPPPPPTKLARVEHAPSSTNGAPELPLSAIDPDPEQPRKFFDDESLRELADSIREIGVLQPISVRANPEKRGRYLVMYGERRYRAAKLAGLTTIPANIGSPQAQHSLREVQMIENIHREALTPMEIAAYLREKLVEGKKKGEIAALIKKSPAFVSRHLALVNLPPILQELFDSGRCSDLSVMYELRGFHKEAPDKTAEWLGRNQTELTRSAISELRNLVGEGEGATGKPKVVVPPAVDAPSRPVAIKPIDNERSETFSRLLGTRVQVEDKQIRISILNPEELKRIEHVLMLGARAASSDVA
jgi:ParB family chromosome partitioning protein